MGNDNISPAGICFSQRICFFFSDKTERIFSQFESFQIASIQYRNAFIYKAADFDI